ncbi:peroxiredoxin [Gemmata sp. JC673]|uniref:thioredoxin-dependent peroxiredoxin n=1 Tax=Gemmata algarum TaxID=2975278 RepID=A0ABU5ERM7_9BACT|nr:peroxiredoxin [Gemmata algarum]MDY3557991.1 peroxiredoxin [Gemmata algarum]
MTRPAAAAAVLCALAALTASADDSTLKVKVGDKFPDVPLAAAQIDAVKKGAKTLSIADLKGKTVVVFFYPKALTSGCTVESCGFRDLMKKGDFPKDVVVLGASADGAELQQQFIDKNGLPMPLLCDTDVKLTKALGILSPKNPKMSQRVTFVVDKEGTIAKIYDKVTPKSHPAEVLEEIKKLK